MREVDEQPVRVQLPDHRPPELRQAGVARLEAAVGQEVAGHVGELDDPDAERGEDADQPLVALERRGVLEAVDEADAAVGLGRADLRDAT